jgi:hypothetical protein
MSSFRSGRRYSSGSDNTRKPAATQELERKDTEIAIERKERTKREVQAALTGTFAAP